MDARSDKPKHGKKRFFVTFFGSNDRLVAALPNPSIDPEGRGEFGTSIVYNRLLFGFDTALGKQAAFRTRTSFGLDNYGFNAGSDIHLESNQYPVMSRNTFTLELPKMHATVQTGLDLYVLPYTVDAASPRTLKLNQVPDPFVSRRLITERSQVTQVEPGVFFDVTWAPTEKVKVIAGIRGDSDTYMNKGWADPRLSAMWQVTDKVLLKGGVGVYHQPPDYRQGELSKTFGNPDLEPEGATQYMVGAETRFTDAISLDVQLYYKDLFDQTRRTQGEGATTNLNVAADDPLYLSNGIGRSYGAELLLRHALTKNFFGWVSYSLSRTERNVTGGSQQMRLSAFDQPHNLIIVASYKLPWDFIIGGRLRYVSGPLNTPIIGSVFDANSDLYVPIPGDFYSRRLPDFFQLDVRLDKRFVFRDWMLAIYVDVQNATNRGNVEAVTYNYDYTQEAWLTGLPILPVLGVRGEF